MEMTKRIDMIAKGKMDIITFLWDPTHAQLHIVNVKTLLRIVVLYNVPKSS